MRPMEVMDSGFCKISRTTNTQQHTHGRTDRWTSTHHHHNDHPHHHRLVSLLGLSLLSFLSLLLWLVPPLPVSSCLFGSEHSP